MYCIHHVITIQNAIHSLADKMKELGWMLSCVQVTLYGHNTGPNSSAPLLVHVPVLELGPVPVLELVLNL